MCEGSGDQTVQNVCALHGSRCRRTWRDTSPGWDDPPWQTSEILRAPLPNEGRRTTATPLSRKPPPVSAASGQRSLRSALGSRVTPLGKTGVLEPDPCGGKLEPCVPTGRSPRVPFRV